jgi:hypothetical protein
MGVSALNDGHLNGRSKGNHGSETVCRWTGLRLGREAKRQRAEEHMPLHQVGHQQIGDLLDPIGETGELQETCDEYNIE